MISHQETREKDTTMITKENPIYSTYVEILKQELIPAMGCTEPIALAYCAAKARSILGELPDGIRIEASGNIIKNVKSVKVPHTGGLTGLEAAAAIGALAGNADVGLEVLSDIQEETVSLLRSYLEEATITVNALESEYLLDMIVTVTKGSESASVQITKDHTNITKITKNGHILYQAEQCVEQGNTLNYQLLSMETIYEFANSVDIADVHEVIKRQIDYNRTIAMEGLLHSYGANIGSTLMKSCPNDVRTRAKAMAAAGSDARMGGCELPVVICSGSGNQGLTTSLPVLEYAKELGASEEYTYRALVLSNLVTLRVKNEIGRLSAYCGAVCAGAGAGAGIAYLKGNDYKEIIHTVVNALAITSGIICDGAKASCAAKIASAVDAGILGYEMYQQGNEFYAGDGIVSNGIENTIRNVGILGRDGMRETDKEIIRMMTVRNA